MEVKVYEEQKQDYQSIIDKRNTVRYLSIVSKEDIRQKREEIDIEFKREECYFTNQQKLQLIGSTNTYLRFKRVFTSKQRQKQLLFEEMKENVAINIEKKKKERMKENRDHIQKGIDEGYRLLMEMEQELHDSLDKSDQY